MQVMLMSLLNTLLTEWLFKRLAYMALKALAASSKNKLDDEAAFIVGQALGLEDKEDKFEE
jgi:hypothetical protein